VEAFYVEATVEIQEKIIPKCQQHKLVLLSDSIDWQYFENEFKSAHRQNPVFMRKS
jgi:hypothetical protein